MEVKASLDHIASLSPAQATGEPVSNKTIAPEKVWCNLFKIFILLSVVNNALYKSF